MIQTRCVLNPRTNQKGDKRKNPKQRFDAGQSITQVLSKCKYILKTSTTC